MKVLIVCSATSGKIAPFILEQADSLRQFDWNYDIFTIRNKGIKGYLKHLTLLRKKILSFKPDIIHAHYGMSGLLANLQRRVPVITTFHGSDINDRNNLTISKLASFLSDACIFVEANMMEKVKKRPKNYLIPCGIDMSVFKPISKSLAKEEVQMEDKDYNVIFASSFSIPVKNYSLAKKACLIAEAKINKRINLIELKGYNRQQVNLLMNACDFALLTSKSEGSPQFIKEAMACNCPIVSTDVGDVSSLIFGVEGCYLCDQTPQSVADKILSVLFFSKRTTARERIFEMNLDSVSVAKKVSNVYDYVYKKRSNKSFFKLFL